MKTTPADTCRKNFTTHGHTTNGITSKTYTAWRGMISRCRYKCTPGWKNYGGRGIRVCSRWENSFLNFLSDMGEVPSGMTLERIDVNGDYEPTNCKWMDAKLQNGNTTRNIFLTLRGKTMTVRSWEREMGYGFGTIRTRIKQGVKGELLLAPLRCRKNLKGGS